MRKLKTTFSLLVLLAVIGVGSHCMVQAQGQIQPKCDCFWGGPGVWINNELEHTCECVHISCKTEDPPPTE
ncbi:MAG: hypothetical protein JST84_31140 [Acidobacteria bacterium]|nr:hypothetical protein [Acidobacteriota bacterium]